MTTVSFQFDPTFGPPLMGQPWPDEAATLARFPRGEDHETRIQLATTGGRVGLSVRLWARGRDGRWHPTRRGVWISPVELPVLRAALDETAARITGPPLRARGRAL